MLGQQLALAAPGRGRGRRTITDLVIPNNAGYGPLGGSEELLLPADFSFVRISMGGDLQTGSMEPIPSSHDGMAAFDGPDGTIRLIRNHEVGTAFPTPGQLQAYDPAAGGGTTSVDFDPVTREDINTFWSLRGTVRNCAGGPTPWNSWLSCEETTVGGGPTTAGFEMQPHGYVFEVDSASDSASDPTPITRMGRFNHEAVAVDAATGFVYLTEDRGASGLYQYRPGTTPTRFGDLAANDGELFMLKVTGREQYDLRTGQRPGVRLPVSWVPIADPDPADPEEDVGDMVYQQGLALGGATLARGEGAWYDDDAIYIVSTNGGDAGAGQVWQYSPFGPGRGVLTLVFESPDREILDAPDNVTVSPNGVVLLCEDGADPEFVRGVTPKGRIFDFASNNESEFAGACFSPDGQWLFVNIQGLATTYAITGPWERGPL